MCVIFTTNSHAPHTITQAVPSKNTLRPLHWLHMLQEFSFPNGDLYCQYGEYYFKKQKKIESSQTKKKKYPRVQTVTLTFK